MHSLPSESNLVKYSHGIQVNSIAHTKELMIKNSFMPSFSVVVVVVICLFICFCWLLERPFEQTTLLESCGNSIHKFTQIIYSKVNLWCVLSARFLASHAVIFRGLVFHLLPVLLPIQATVGTTY